MTEPGTTRDPRKSSSTATSTAASIGIPGMFLIWIIPDIDPQTVLAVSGAFTIIIGWLGSAARDSEFLNVEANKGSWKGLLVTFFAKVLG